MTKLYTDFALLYHKIYPSFIDYEEQYQFYADLLLKYNCERVLELGCGTGHLAKRMLADGWGYQGMDLSEEMLAIARHEVPQGHFFQADMRNFALEEKVDAIIIPARSISYLLENKDVMAALSACKSNLVQGGKLVFDVIDAFTHLSNIDATKSLIHNAQDGHTSWERQSVYRRNLQYGWTWDWHSVYFEVHANGQKREVACDEATLRAFLSEEVALFLKLAEFKKLEVLELDSYAFKTFVFVAENADSEG